MSNRNYLVDNVDRYPQPEKIINPKAVDYNKSITTLGIAGIAVICIAVAFVMYWANIARFSTNTTEMYIGAGIFYGVILLVPLTIITGITIAARYFYNIAKLKEYVEATKAMIPLKTLNNAGLDARHVADRAFDVERTYAENSKFRGMYGSYAPDHSISTHSNNSASNGKELVAVEAKEDILLPDEFQVDTLAMIALVNEGKR